MKWEAEPAKEPRSPDAWATLFYLGYFGQI